jgi:hypothetical protein
MTELEYDERQSQLLGGGEFPLSLGEEESETMETEQREQGGGEPNKKKNESPPSDEERAPADPGRHWDWWRAMAEAYRVEIQTATREFAYAAHEDISQKQVIDYGNCISRMPKEQPPPPPGLRSRAGARQTEERSADPGPLLKRQPADIGSGGGLVPDIEGLEAAKPTKGFAGGAWHLHDHDVITMVALAAELTAIASEVGRCVTSYSRTVCNRIVVTHVVCSLWILQTRFVPNHAHDSQVCVCG